MKIIEWKISDKIKAGTTLRSGGFSKGPLASLNMALNVNDHIENVIQNRKLLAQYLNTDLAHMVSPTQTHSTHLKKVTIADGGRGMWSLDDAFDDTDALYTRDKNLYLLTYHADCIPVLLYDAKEELICSIHSGWKGNVNEITLKSLRYLQAHENCQPKNIYAYIGPSLGYDAFEARDDIINLVKKMEIDSAAYYTETKPGIYHLDAKGLAKAQMLHFGIPEENITVDPHCTKSEPDLFFSYRQDHACGRHVSFIAML